MAIYEFCPHVAGLYFHIPFCRKVCSYCNFHFSTNTRNLDPLLDAMEYELEREQDFLPEKTLQSVYFGGGTPSFVPADRIQRLLSRAAEHFNIAKDAEITLEANPEDIVPENLKAWKQAGINRLSLGIQSLDAADLEHMNRNHSAGQAKSAVTLLLDAGFPSLNIDLIFGSPWLSDSAWQETLEWAFACGADHISAYALTVEPKTFLNRKIAAGEWPGTDDNRQASHYQMLTDFAADKGWDFYEISNLSKPGHAAVHNSNYWKNLPYLGIGPSAHSYRDRTRRWNVADNKKYTDLILNRETAYESETLSDRDLLNEHLLTRIRTTEGVAWENLQSFGTDITDQIRARVDEFNQNGWTRTDAQGFYLTTAGRLMADHITAELMA